MEGLLEFCYEPVLPSSDFSTPANATFEIWYNGDFGLCFEYLVFITFLSALFGVTSAVYAGWKYTVIKRRRIPIALAARAAVSLCVILNTGVEFIASFMLAPWRPYSVLLAEIVRIISWSVHLFCIYVLWTSVRHSGRGPLTLHATWFLAFIGDIIHFRTVIRWNTQPSDYPFLHISNDYFSLLLQITTYVHFGLQCLYTATLIFSVPPVTDDNIKIPLKKIARRLYSGSTQFSDEDEEYRAAQQHLVTSKTDGSTTYGSVLVKGLHDHTRRRGEVDTTKLEASEDKANILSLLSFWWVRPLMKRGDLGLLEKPDDLLQLPKSLETSNIRAKFLKVLQRYRGNHSSASSQTSPSRSYGVGVGVDGMETTNQQACDVDESETSTVLHSLIGSTQGGPRKKTASESGNGRGGGGSKISLFWALNRAFGLHYYPLGLLKLLADGLGFAGPLLLHALVSFMENRNVRRNTASMWYGFVSQKLPLAHFSLSCPILSNVCS